MTEHLKAYELLIEQLITRNIDVDLTKGKYESRKRQGSCLAELTCINESYNSFDIYLSPSFDLHLDEMGSLLSTDAVHL